LSRKAALAEEAEGTSEDGVRDEGADSPEVIED